MKTKSPYLKVIIVNGRPGVGKTTFEDFCQEIMGQVLVKKRSTIDIIKEIASNYGWNGQKTPRDRKFLSDLKDLFSNYNNLPHKDIENYIENWEDDLALRGLYNRPHILFVDSREPEDIQKLKDEFEGMSLLIRRPGDEEIETSNHADEDVFKSSYDFIVYNNGTVFELKQKAMAFIKWIFS